VRAPAAALGAKVVLVPEEEGDATFATPNRGPRFPWSLRMTLEDGSERRIHSEGGWHRTRVHKPPYRFTALMAEFPKHEGVAIFTRPMFPQGVLSDAMRKQGIRTVAETDDNYFAKSEQTLYLRQKGFGEMHRMTHAKSFARQDACVFSTEWLLLRYRREFRERFGRRGMPQLYVCQNNIPLSDWPERIERDGPIRVGFMGSTSHVWDINIAYAALKLAHEAGCMVTMIGYNPGNPDPGVPDVYVDEEGVSHQMHSERSIEAREKWAEVIDRHIPWVSSEDYRRGGLPLDVGLCPLVNDDFSMARSDVKAIEYSISGAAVVCANNVVYNRAGWKHEVNCLMANSYREFAGAVVRLIRNPKLRYELVSNAQEYVEKERGLDQLREEWGAVIDG